MLRALHEAGIKIDVMAGRGVGVVGSLFAAVDSAQKTWEEGGLWRRRSVVLLYRWRLPLRLAGVLVLAAAAALVVPLLVIATGLLAYPAAFLVQMVDADAGRRMADAYAAAVSRAFAPQALPTLIPRLTTLLLAAAALTLAASAFRQPTPERDARGGRRRRPWWGRLVGALWSADPAVAHYQRGLWEIFLGATGGRAGSRLDLSRRYVELLTENLGQPGFRELIVTTLDLESRSDLVFALVAEPRRDAFFHRERESGGRGSKAARSGPERPGDLVDLAGVGRVHVVDALAGALSLAVVTDPHPVVFSPESYWKGETHRICDSPSGVGRLLHELAVAGVEQVIVVAASDDRSAPHRLSRPAGGLHGRVAEYLSAAEATALRGAVAMHAGRFARIFVVQPTHNPIRPLDLDGVYDERSDRFQRVEELVDRGYQDAYRQFIDQLEPAS